MDLVGREIRLGFHRHHGRKVHRHILPQIDSELSRDLAGEEGAFHGAACLASWGGQARFAACGWGLADVLGFQVHDRVASRGLGVEANVFAGDQGKGYVEVDGHGRLEGRRGGVDCHVVHDLHPRVGHQFRDEEQEAQAGAGHRHQAAHRGPDLHAFRALDIEV